MRIFLLYFLVIFCSYTQVCAQVGEQTTMQNLDSTLQNTEIIEIANPFPTLKNHVYYTITTKNNNNLENIAQLPFKKLNFGLNNDVKIQSDSIYWVKTQLYSKLQYDKEFLFNIGNVANVEIYAEYPDKKIIKRITGNSYSNNIRDIKQSYKSVRLLLPKNQLIKVWIRYESKNKPSYILLRLFDKEKINEIWFKRDFSAALLQGAFWIMMLYNFLLFFVFKDRAYLYYVCYIFVSTVFIALQIVSYEFWFLDQLIAYLYIIAYLCLFNVAVFYILFVKYFVRQDEDYPKLAKYSTIYVGIRTVINLIIVVLILRNVITEPFGNGTNIILIFDIIFGIYSVIIIAKGKKNMLLNRFLLAGSICLFGGGAIDTITGFFNFVIIENFSFFTYGFLGEIIIFTFGLAQRSSMIEKEKQKAQQELILQLEANDELQRNINRDLEQKVAERTLEVVHQNEELEANSQLLMQQNDRLDKAYTHITDSVRYAKRIQTALLPSKTTWEAVLPNSFVLYKPKDIVSGDFYWFAKEKDNIFVAVADCTGHGVPGAFMTVIGNNILNQIISENINNDNNQKSIEPAYILTELDKRLLQTLQQQGVEASKDKINDGMDIALAKINTSTSQITVSSAKRVVYQFRNNELIEHEPNKFPIGSSHFGGKIFEQKVINYQPNDIFYLFTDGYPDQFGGTENRKFMIKQFRNLLIEIHNLPLSEQHQILNTRIENWKNGITQTDDILVMGLKM
jgi:serine phosphatase RsbU (regulator of sigma subunit)